MNYTFLRYLIFSALFIGCSQNPDGFVINTEIKDLGDGNAVLLRRVDGEFISLDSTEIKNENFTFKGEVDQPEMYYINVNDTLPYIRFFIENTRISISAHVDSLRNPDIKGSEINDALRDYNEMMKPYDKKLREIYQQYSAANIANDSAEASKYEIEFDLTADKQKAASIKFVEENSDNVIGPYLTWGTLAYDLSIHELEKIAENFGPEVSNSIYVKQIKDYINTLKKVDIGQPFTDIALPSPEGEINKLSDHTGKIILIDFWASWCGPCRRENPNVVALYNDFKDENFEIFGVSLDQHKDRWIKAIEDDNLSWEHVSDLKGWNSEAGKLYGVRSIPHTVLINSEGIIIDKNLRGEDLRKRVEELIRG